MTYWKKSWWVFAFCSLLSLFYFHFYSQKKTDLRVLKSRLRKMEEEKYLCLQRQSELKNQIASQDDPAWIELILMRDLGVVPEGYLKVHFKK